MIPYYVLLVILLLQLLVIRRLKIIHNKLSDLITFLTLTLFCGLRSAEVGTDTSNYLFYFNYNWQNPFLKPQFSSSSEKGYLYLEYFSSLISDSSNSILLIAAVITIGIFMISINNNSENPPISLIVYVCCGFYTFAFNGVRQAIALSIFSLGLIYLVNGKRIKLLSVILIASLFHKSVLLTLPVLLLDYWKFSKLSIVMFTIITLATIPFFKSLLAFSTLINDKYSIYSEFTNTGGNLLLIYHISISFLFYFFRDKIQVSKIVAYDLYLKLYLIGTAIFFLVVTTSSYIEISRLAIYFHISQVFIWPMIFNSSAKNLFLLKICFFVLSIGYFSITLLRIGDLIPYKFYN